MEREILKRLSQVREWMNDINVKSFDKYSSHLNEIIDDAESILGVDRDKSEKDEMLDNAAKRLCEIRGIDPDVMVGHSADPNPDGSVNAVYLKSPAWTRVRRELVSFSEIAECLGYVRR